VHPLSGTIEGILGDRENIGMVKYFKFINIREDILSAGF